MPRLREVIRVRDHPYLITNPVSYLVERGYLPQSLPLPKAVELLEASSLAEKVILEGVVKTRFPPEGEWEQADTPRALLAFHAALAVLGSLGNPWYTRRMALAVAKSSSPRLAQAGDRELGLVARILGMDVRVHSENPLRVPWMLYKGRPVQAEFGFSMNFIDYARWSRRLSGDPAWKLTNQLLRGSRVFLKRDQLIRLLEEAVSRRVEGLAEGLSESLAGQGGLPYPLDRIRDGVVEELEKAAPPPRAGGGGVGAEGPIVYEAFPPCMAKILREAQQGVNLSHHQRFAIATFLIRLGASEDEVVDVFRSLPDFKEKVTRYQVQHLMGARGGGKKYLPYNCEKMRTLNLCVADCGTRTPLQKYFQNLREYRRGRGETRSRGGGAPGKQ